MLASISEFIRLLEIEANRAAGMELPSNTFSELSAYLATFSIDPNICPLPRLVSSTVDEVVYNVLTNLFDDEEDLFGNIGSEEERRNCLLNATQSFMQADTNIITNVLGRLLYDYREFVKSIYLAEKVITQVKWHTFSPSCLVALTRMKYCAICGGYTNHPPCLNLCLNTFRGCVADVAEMHADFSQLISLLRGHTMDMLPSFQLDAIMDILRNFVSLIRNIVNNKHDLRVAVSPSIIIYLFIYSCK